MPHHPSPLKLPRLNFGHFPTPLHELARLGERLGIDLWIKRDDASAGAEAGNKVRKLEFLLGQAVAERSTAVITCGGLQSNHARATAILAARLGLSCSLLLRAEPLEPGQDLARELNRGNAFLARMVGAEVRVLTAAEYQERDALMNEAARELAARGERPFVIPEGGSNGLGSAGYVEAMRELRWQIDLGLAGDKRPFDVIVHACGSGGTASGVALGAALHGTAHAVHAVAVCNDASYFRARCEQILAELRALLGEHGPHAPLFVDDQAKGPAYGVMSPEQRAFLVDAARTSGLVLDPVYTGKALFGLAKAVALGTIPRGARVLFLHTGGLPGLLARPDALASELRARRAPTQGPK